MSDIALPDELASLLTDAGTLNALFDALGPAHDERLDENMEFEVEVEGGATYRITYKKRALKAKKGFARGEPFASVKCSESMYTRMLPILKKAAAGFAGIPRLQAQLDKNRALQRPALEKVHAAFEDLPPVCIEIALEGEVMLCARGAFDVATQKLRIEFPADVFAQMEAGNPVVPKIVGDLGAKTKLLAALAPLLPAAAG